MLATAIPTWLQTWLPDGWGWTQLLILAVVLFFSTMLLSLLSVAIVIVRLPEDYLMPSYDAKANRPKHPVLRILWLIARNVFGILLVALGVVLSLPGVPGQGLLTIFMGLLVMDFPGKRRLERWMIGRPTLLQAANRLRARWNRPPLQDPHRAEVVAPEELTP
ncbi:hypothetical protein [Tuwongella immobilis]|uniref:Transmembrane protein (PGPGW) n=1 Tax=Tuwongella immobilis TaxID=692036 RepID=A0A6C2YP64_9BACT|nr:hypothetical protein [Tuwongella immobilis]VIP03157.1 Uncharacterized protein OS=Sorangium cellulosum So0157-2 GN=SCE1572_02675 PE=4 SV=1 [Tuwongella immobilis]VTS03558.1 Uncharacterized protein OS=Sorangium cellulosum So0157-2 GN=SCE1572_02675 PE=4 SV=1 [Tuwongella immobilis]